MFTRRWQSLAEEAKKRQQEHGKTAPGKTKSLPVNLPEVLVTGDSRDKVGKLFKVSGKSVSDANLVQKYGTQEEIKAVEKQLVAP